MTAVPQSAADVIALRDRHSAPALHVVADDAPADIVATPTPDVHHGQVRIAYRLADTYAARLMFVHEVGWHHYDGTRWIRDTRGHAKRAVYDELRRALADSADDKSLRGDVAKCESAAGIAGVLDIASALEPFAFTVDDLDRDPYLLNVANGTLELRSMTLRPHDPANRCTKVTAGAYRSNAASATWAKFLATSLPDEDVRDCLQRYVGSALAGRVLEHKLGILTGTGRNGKGVLDRALGHALGDYATTAEPDLFMARENAHPTGLMDLLGVRWVVVSESEKGRSLAESVLKRLTGGDRIRARRMRQDFVEFEPSHTAALVTNFLPKASGDDEALWARLLVFPFDVVIAPEDRDPTLPEKLEAAADAVLAWAIQGWSDYRAQGLNPPDAVKAATDSYRSDSDTVARFIADRCHPFGKYVFSAIHDAYSDWARSEGLPQLGKPQLKTDLRAKGYTLMAGTGNKTFVQGLVLAAADDG